MSNIGYMKYDTYKDICNAVREKTKEDNLYLASELPEKIRNIKSGGFDFISESRDYNFTNDNPHPTVNITTQNNEAYFIYDNRDRKAWWSISLSCTGTLVVAVGHLSNDGEYIEDSIINEALKNNVVTSGFVDIDYDYAVIKVSGLITNWTLSTITYNGTKSTLNNQKLIEIIADVPAFIGSNASSAVYKISYFTRKFTLKNAVPTYINYFCNGGYSLEEFTPVNVDFNTKLDIRYTGNFFYNCFKIKEIDLSRWNLEKNISLAGMFYGCSSLQRVNLNNVKGKITSLASAFYGCLNLKEIDLSPLDTSECVALGSLFYNCHSLEKIKWSDNTFGKITSIGSMFQTCHNLKNLILPNFDLSNCTNLSNVFYNCFSLVFDDDLINKIQNWNVTNKCTTLASMFYNCYGLQELDLSGWDISGITTLTTMFSGCWSLKKVKFPVCNIPNITTFNTTFYYCYSLKEIDLSVLTVGSNNIDCSGMFNLNYSIKSIKLPLNVKPTTLANVFVSCWSLTNLENFETWDTSNTTSFNSVFSGCISLRNIDISNIKLTNKCTTLASTFYNCYSLEEIVFPTDEQDGSNIKSINAIIQNCYNLKRFECKIDMPLVNDARYFGDNCQRLKYVDTLISLSNVTTYPPTYTAAVDLEYANFSSYPSIAMNLKNGINFSKDYILDVINKLPVLTTAKTLTLGEHKYKLTDAELKIATDKKWTIA